MNIGMIIKDIRKRKGLSQTELANKCGLSKNGLWNYENGNRSPSFDTLHSISDALGIDILELFVHDTEISNNIKYRVEVKLKVYYDKPKWIKFCEVDKRELTEVVRVISRERCSEYRIIEINTEEKVIRNEKFDDSMKVLVDKERDIINTQINNATEIVMEKIAKKIKEALNNV